ncbi:hypothetical protein FA95DRAFT_676282 [Auriscalpium vulgare]|uniref:Uncharacterized protein n=1 Tax=Auriscalpium vulgare TaxID=40419 RepID=A0ACB8RC53_9AGAM|nr:hypothetical protein FA95DRAFT_676282 [Auriscalpium vulgare]
MHAYARAGAEYFKLESTVDGLQILLHISFALFFAGLAEFLFPIDGALGWIFLGPVCFGGLIYLGFTAIPIISPSAPYSTPLSTIWIFAMRRRREQGVGLLIPLLMLLKHFVMAVPRLLYGIVQFVDGPNRGLLIEPGFMLEFYTFLGLRDAAHPDGFPLDSRVEEILVATKCDLSLDATAMGWTLARIMHRNEDLEKFMDALALAQPCERAKRTATTVLVTRGFHQRLTRVFEMPRFKGILGHAKGQVSLVLSCLQALRHVVNLEPDMGSCWRTFQAVLEPMRKLERGGNKTISFDAMYTAAILSLYLLKEVEKTDEPAFTDSLLSFISRHLQDADRPAGRTDQLARLQSTGRMDIVANFVDNLLTCDSDTLEPNINLVLAFLQDLNLEPPAADEHRKWIRDEMRRVCQSLIKKGWPDSKELHTLYTTEEDLPNLPDTIASNPLSKLYEALRAIDIPLSAPPGDQTAGQSGQVPSAPPPGQGPATYPPSSSARQTASTRRPSANDGYTSLPGHDSEDIEAQLGRA